MKIFTEKKILKKLILVLMVLVVFNAVLPSNISCAEDDEPFGGKLMKPIMDFLLGLGDFIMDIIHNVVYEMNKSLIRVDLDQGWLEFLGITLAVIAAVVVIVIVGAALVSAVPQLLVALGTKLGLTMAAVGATSISAVGTIVVTAIAGGAVAGMYVHSTWFGKEAVLPLYRVTPEEIFTNQVKLLNPNFFGEVQGEIETSSKIEDTGNNVVVIMELNRVVGKDDEGYDEYGAVQTNQSKKVLNDELKYFGYEGPEITLENRYGYWGERNEAELIEGTVIVEWSYDGSTYQARIDSINTFDQYMYEDGVTHGYVDSIDVHIYKTFSQVTRYSVAEQLKGTMAKWYYNIRNIAIVAMMVILLYIGIRMMLCGIASEKAKYKNMFFDWLVAICLMFVMHYIMVFSMNVSESIIEVFSSLSNKQNYLIAIEDENGKIREALEEDALENRDSEYAVDKIVDDDVISWDAKNLMGLIRVTAAQEESGTYLYMGYVLCFLVLVWYTLFFLVTYIRRVIYIVFLTIIAPFVAMTYPLDKIHDGKAQAFDMWLKEYIINLLIPVVHTVLYLILVGSAFELASTNVIYSLVAIGFMLPAEKFVRKMFGFDRAQTPGFLGGAAGAALAMTAFNNLLKPRRHVGGGKNNGGSDKGNEKLEDMNKKTDHSNVSAMFKKPSKDSELSSEERNKAMISQRMKQLGLNKEVLKNAKKSSPKLKTRAPSGNSSESAQDKTRIPASSGNKTNRKKNYLAGIKGASKAYARQKLQRGANYFASGQPIRSMARMAGGLYLGATGAMLGASLGIAAEDPSKILQYGGSLGAAGYALGSREHNSNIDEEAVKEEYERGLYGDEYEQVKQEEKIRKSIESEKNQRELQRYLDLQDLESAKRVLEEHEDCISDGMDMKDIATIKRLVDDRIMDKETAITARKFNKKAGGSTKEMGEEDIKKVRRIFSEVAKDNGIPETEIEGAINSMIHYTDTFDEYRGKLSKIK